MKMQKPQAEEDVKLQKSAAMDDVKVSIQGPKEETKMAKPEATKRPSDADIADALQMFLPAAALKAKESESALATANFLRSKGIPLDVAKVEAEKLVSQHAKSQFRKSIPRKILGWSLVALGALPILAAILALFFGIWVGGTIIVAGLPIAVGGWLLFGDHGS